MLILLSTFPLKLGGDADSWHLQKPHFLRNVQSYKETYIITEEYEHEE